MAYVISDDCIACGTCIDECPSGAISEGEKKFTALAVAADHGDEYIVPCGICRQFICEFCPPEFPIILVKSEDDFKVSSLGELLPAGFVL